MSIEVIAHRGYSAVAPENTLSALRAALEARADAVEFDLHVASCGTPVLFHDAHLGRTSNGVGPVRRRTLAQLQAFDAGSWFSSEFAGERIPSFDQALELLAPTPVRIYAEVKGYRELEDLDRMVEIARARDLESRIVFISMDWGTIERIGGRSDLVKLGWIVEKADRFEDGLSRAVAAGRRGMVDFDRRLVLADPSLARRTREAGAELAVWTVDDPAEAEVLYAAGVRRFTTNRVREIQRWRAERSAGE